MRPNASIGEDRSSPNPNLTMPDLPESAPAHRAGPAAIAAAARALGLAEDAWLPYGRGLAKILTARLGRAEGAPRGALVLVTAITPTPSGEGKTTVAIGLADALARLGRRAVAALRQPSLGPVFGRKGGATGGGRARLLPQESIELHGTGDLHAVAAAHNLVAAVLENHLHFGDALGIDPRAIPYRRALDVNDRALRRVRTGIGTPEERESGFDIVAACETLVVLGLARDAADLLRRLEAVVVGFTREGRPVRARDIRAAGAAAALLRDALLPNLAVTSEGNPALVHGGPFANVSVGTTSVAALAAGLALAEVVICEAGFAADLGAEKLLDVVCPAGGLPLPSAAVLVATVRALRRHGGAPRDSGPDPEAVARGLANLERHVSILGRARLPVLVALNVFEGDSEEELRLVEARARDLGCAVARCDCFARGGEGAVSLAEALLATLARGGAAPRPLVEPGLPVEETTERIALDVYGADGVEWSARAREDLARLAAVGLERGFVSVAKTPLSLSDDPAKAGAPSGFRIAVREVRFMAGAGIAIPIAGDIETMPGLPRVPAAERITLAPGGAIEGLV
jgi:formate--tetrahydrofolate ligase